MCPPHFVAAILKRFFSLYLCKRIRQVNAARSKGKVFSMAFVGINGVGKSTSLAKVAYYLKENGIKVCRCNSTVPSDSTVSSDLG